MNKKITISLSERDVEWLKALAIVESVNPVDILRRAIRTEKFINDCEKKGRKILIESADGKRIPTYGFYPVIKEDFLEAQQEKTFPAQQIFTANKIYSGTIHRFTH